MAECNATLTTATAEPCLCDPFDPCVDNHVTLHTFKCSSDRPCKMPLSHCHTVDVDDHTGERIVQWWDHTPGATPHEPPLVSDEEVEAAISILTCPPSKKAMRLALEAAAKARLGCTECFDLLPPARCKVCGEVGRG